MRRRISTLPPAVATAAVPQTEPEVFDALELIEFVSADMSRDPRRDE